MRIFLSIIVLVSFILSILLIGATCVAAGILGVSEGAEVNDAVQTIPAAAEWLLETNTSGDIVLSDLSLPIIKGIDVEGNIYFSERRDDTWLLEKFNPHTGDVVELVSYRNAWFKSTIIAPNGDLYYILAVPGDSIWTYEIHKFSKITGVDSVLYSRSVNRSEVFSAIDDIDVDAFGNVYFCENRYRYNFTRFGVDPIPPSRLMMITRDGEIRELTEIEDGVWMKGLQVPLNPEEGVYFTVKRSDAYYIYRYRDGTLEAILTRPIENLGTIGYTAMSAGGDLYYLYRQRSANEDPIQWAYLEIGYFSKRDLKKGSEPLILRSKYFDG